MPTAGVTVGVRVGAADAEYELEQAGYAPRIDELLRSLRGRASEQQREGEAGTPHLRRCKGLQVPLSPPCQGAV